MVALQPLLIYDHQKQDREAFLAMTILKQQNCAQLAETRGADNQAPRQFESLVTVHHTNSQSDQREKPKVPSRSPQTMWHKVRKLSSCYLGKPSQRLLTLHLREREPPDCQSPVPKPG